MTLKITVGALAGLCLISGLAMAQDAAPSRNVWDGVYTADQATRGQAAYDSTCSACHGQALGGGDMAPALVDMGFLSKWSGQSMGDLFARIHDTMPTDNPGSLSAATTADIEAYILSQNQIPAGSAELAGDQQVQQQIRISSFKP
jgi:quinoprotein glucose dehydrogenase